jgi:hypothetical protein
MNGNIKSVIATTALFATIALSNVGNEPRGTTRLEDTGAQLSRDERSTVQSPGVAAETHGYTWDKTVRPAGDVAPVRRLR